jgi:hypothetical protein
MWVDMTLMEKYCVDQFHPTGDGFLTKFEFFDFVYQDFAYRKVERLSTSVLPIPKMKKLFLDYQ